MEKTCPACGRRIDKTTVHCPTCGFLYPTSIKLPAPAPRAAPSGYSPVVAALLVCTGFLAATAIYLTAEVLRQQRTPAPDLPPAPVLMAPSRPAPAYRNPFQSLPPTVPAPVSISTPPPARFEAFPTQPAPAVRTAPETSPEQPIVPPVFIRSQAPLTPPSSRRIQRAPEVGQPAAPQSAILLQPRQGGVAPAVALPMAPPASQEATAPASPEIGQTRT